MLRVWIVDRGHSRSVLPVLSHARPILRTFSGGWNQTDKHAIFRTLHPKEKHDRIAVPGVGTNMDRILFFFWTGRKNRGLGRGGMKRAVAQPSAVLFVSRPAWRERPVRSAISVDDVVSTSLNLENRERDRKPNKPSARLLALAVVSTITRKEEGQDGSVESSVRSVVEEVRWFEAAFQDSNSTHANRETECQDEDETVETKAARQDNSGGSRICIDSQNSRSYRTLEKGNDWLARKGDVVERNELEEDGAKKADELSSPGRCRHRRSAGRAAGSPAGHRSCCCTAPMEPRKTRSRATRDRAETWKRKAKAGTTGLTSVDAEERPKRRNGKRTATTEQRPRAREREMEARTRQDTKTKRHH